VYRVHSHTLVRYNVQSHNPVRYKVRSHIFSGNQVNCFKSWSVNTETDRQTDRQPGKTDRQLHTHTHTDARTQTAQWSHTNGIETKDVHMLVAWQEHYFTVCTKSAGASKHMNHLTMCAQTGTQAVKYLVTTRQAMYYKVTLRRVCITVVAAEEH